MINLLGLDDINSIDFDGMELKASRKGGKTIRYYNEPVAYDIETSSFRDELDNPVAITYSHCLNVAGQVFLFRTWEEFTISMDYIRELAGLDAYTRMIVYVHNLSYEFQFMKHHFEWARNGILFNGGDRKVLSAVTQGGFEFRCSMMLSGASLAVTARNLTEYKIEKLKGDLDYDLIHTPITPLTQKELGYIVNDVVIIEYFIREAMLETGDITKLPLTNTGYVRNYCRSNSLVGKGRDKQRYRALMQELTVEEDEYTALSGAFAGGFTHANVLKVNQIHENVTANDIVSSYPGRTFMYQFPMGKGEEYDCKDKEDFFDQLDTHCCLFYVRLEGLNRKANEAYISISKCTDAKDFTVNNGRVEAAGFVELWVTDVDFELIMMSYTVEDFSIGTMYRYKRGYLPTSIIEAIIKFFNDKTTLKDLEDKASEYLKAKGMLNSTYGMMVMDIVREHYEFNHLTKSAQKGETDNLEALTSNNNSKKRFLFYPWGVWITAYARYEVFSVIVKLGDDYIYCDTDSIYFTNGDKYKELFEEENKRILDLLHRACDYHGFDYDVLSPMDKKGKKHTIGIWSHDGFYTRFKTLGAKRYMTEKHIKNKKGKKKKKIEITVSGINKTHAMPYLLKTYKSDIFEAFNKDLYVPAGACGKKTHTYIPHECRGTIRDYKGVPYTYYERSGIHLQETFYSMTISDEFSAYFEYLQNNARG